MTAECRRVLKPSGSIWVNLGDKYASPGGVSSQPFGKARHHEAARVGGTPSTFGYRPKSLMGLPWRYAIGCIDDLDLILRAEVIWSKPNGLPESVTDRVRRSHEQWFHFTKEPRYFAAVDEVREAHAAESIARAGRARLAPDLSQEGVGSPNTLDPTLACNPLGKLPGSVWTIPSEPLKVPDHIGVDHFAAFPQEWPRRIILGWSPSDGVVLDPFGGTGTVAMVARALGRFGVSMDLSRDYLRLAQWRVFKSGHWMKTVTRMYGQQNDKKEWKRPPKREMVKGTMVKVDGAVARCWQCGWSTSIRSHRHGEALARTHECAL